MDNFIDDNVQHGTEHRLFGSPGTGKTYTLMTYIRKFIQQGILQNVLISSFTKGAAKELVARIDKENAALYGEDDYEDTVYPNIGTLHSICYKALGGGIKIAETNKVIGSWNDSHPQWRITGSSAASVDDLDEMPSSDDLEGAKLLSQLNVLRSRMEPKESYPDDVADFAEEWKTWKYETGCLDYNDLIYRCLRDVDYAPDRPEIGIYDEVQDCSRLQLSLINKWMKNMRYVLKAGDDDQAGVLGTKITMSDNSVKNIEDLEIGDKIRGYNFTHSKIQCNQVVTEIARTPYDGSAVRVTVGNLSTVTTHNHPWVVRMNNNAHHSEQCVVYLMRQADRWKIGWCKLMRADGCLHLPVRCRQENTDEAWVLEVTDTRQHASVLENYYSAQYGIPTLCFEPTNAGIAGYVNPESIKYLWGRLNPVEQKARAYKCLAACGRYPEFPIFKKGTLNVYGARNMKVIACNLLPEVMSVPIPTQDRKVIWEPIQVSREYYKGDVVGLNVEKTHSYIADGIVTHNCIYRFAGASPEAFLFPAIDPKHIKVLPLSRRLPRKILKFTKKWIERVNVRQPKEFVGKDEDGLVGYMPSAFHYKNPEYVCEVADKFLRDGKTVMILASCSYMLSPTIKSLMDNGVPFSNTYRPKRGDWNPLQKKAKMIARIMAYLKYSLKDGINSTPWNTQDIALWASAMKIKDGLIKRGASKVLEMWGQSEFAYRISSAEALMEIFEEDEVIRLVTTEPDIDWWYNQLKNEYQESANYPLRIAQLYGKDTLNAKPKLTVGTIHSVKGGEAEVVIVMPDLSKKGMNEWNGTEEERDSIRRVFYVGATRASETLILASPASAMAIDWEM